MQGGECLSTRFRGTRETPFAFELGPEGSWYWPNQETNFQSLTFKHLLLPIWLLTVMYQGQPFQVYINGVTGEVHGERPYSKVKIGLAYTTRHYALKYDPFDGDLAINPVATPDHPRGAFFSRPSLMLVPSRYCAANGPCTSSVVATR